MINDFFANFSMLATGDQVVKATWESVYMVLVSGGLATLFGIPLGLLLSITKSNNLTPHKGLHFVLSLIVNIGRSVPYIILLVAITPFTRALVGTSIGTNAAIVSLTLAAVPFVARLVEGALMEVSTGLIEAAQAMGATNMQIIFKVLLPEAFAGIANSVIITAITLVGYSAMAGAVGGGGLGALAINYGHQRYDSMTILVTVILLVALVQLVQSLGDILVRSLDHR